MQYRYIPIEEKKTTAEDLEREHHAVLPPLFAELYSMRKTIRDLKSRLKKI